MRKLVIFLIMLLFPFVVSAEKYEYQITSKVELDNKEIEENEFTFELLDSDGNVIDTKKNDKDGNIIFDSIAFNSSGVNISGGTGNGFAKSRNYGYKFYIIRQVVENEEVYQYDKAEAYIGVYYFSDGTSEVHYLKDIDKMIDKWTYKAERDPSKIFHATEEQLQGEAYAVLDTDTGILSFFRDQANKYNNNQTIGNKIYYTNIEGDINYDAPWSGDNRIKKIVFEDPIKPKKISNRWFRALRNLEEIENINLLDTSLITSFDSVFEYDEKITKLDLSSWDTSSVVDMSSMFYNCINLEEVHIDNFDTSKVKDFAYMFRYTKVKTIDASIFDVSSATNIQGMFYDVQGIEAFDFSTWSNDNMPSAGMLVSDCPDVKFVDITTISKIGSNGVGMNKGLSVINLSGDYEYFTSGIGNYDYYWFNLKNRTLYTYWDLRQLIDFDSVKVLEPATYVRPDNNPIPSIFTNKYIVKEEVDSNSYNTDGNETPNPNENPNTKDTIIPFIILFLGSLLGYVYFKKRKLEN